MSATAEPWAPRGKLGPTVQVTSSVGPFSADTVVISGTWTVVAGRSYKATADAFDFLTASTVAGDRFSFWITVGGTKIGAAKTIVIPIAAGVGMFPLLVRWYNAASSGAVTVAVHGIQSSGSGTASVNGSVGDPIELAFEDVGLT